MGVIGDLGSKVKKISSGLTHLIPPMPSRQTFSNPFRRPGENASVPAPAPPPTQPLPASVVQTPVAHNVKTMILENAGNQLIAKKSEWEPALIALANALLNDFQNKNVQNCLWFQHDESREIIKNYINEWNGQSLQVSTLLSLRVFSNKPNVRVVLNEKNLDELNGIFSPVIVSIRCEAESLNPKDEFLQLLEWDFHALTPTQQDFSFSMKMNDNGSERASAIINIDQHSRLLTSLYQKWKSNYDAHKQNPAIFVEQAHRHLRNFFNELLKLNADTTDGQNRWKEPSVQAALRYYFDQRELLYKIYSRTAGQPVPMDAVMTNVIKMRQYKLYILEMYGRSEEYTSNHLGLNWGVDRNTKINAALDQYYQCCGMPGDEKPQRDPVIEKKMYAASANGRLSKIVYQSC